MPQKRAGILAQREGEHKQCQEYDEIFIWPYHFAESYLDKLVNEQCHRNARQLGKHIECTQEHYQIEKF